MFTYAGLCFHLISLLLLSMMPVCLEGVWLCAVKKVKMSILFGWSTTSLRYSV